MQWCDSTTPDRDTSTPSSIAVTRSFRVRVRSHTPLPPKAFIVACKLNATVYDFRERLHACLGGLSEVHWTADQLLMEIDGFSFLDASELVREIYREQEVIDVCLPQLKNDEKVNIRKGSSIDYSTASASGSTTNVSSNYASSREHRSTSIPTLPSSAQAGAAAHGSLPATIDTWVTPGNGLAKTQRKNRNRREKKRQRNLADQAQRFAEAVSRVEKRMRIEEKNLKEVESVPIGHHEDKEMIGDDDLPPGHGHLGFPFLNNGSDEISGVSMSKKVIPAADASVRPPTERDSILPLGVRLNRFDCDDCYNPWPAQDATHIPINDGQDDDYAQFQAHGKSELERIRRDEQELSVVQQEQVLRNSDQDDPNTNLLAFGMPIAFGKSSNWDGKAVIAHWGEEMHVKGVPTADTLDYGEPDPTGSKADTLDQLRDLRSRLSGDLATMRNAAFASRRSLKL